MMVHIVQARNQGGSVGSYEPPPPRDHIGPLGPYVFLYAFRKLDCHNFHLLFKLWELTALPRSPESFAVVCTLVYCNCIALILFAMPIPETSAV